MSLVNSSTFNKLHVNICTKIKFISQRKIFFYSTSNETPLYCIYFHSLINDCYFYFQEKGVFLYDTGVSKEYLKHEKIQSNMELVLLCISIAAVVLALVLLTVLR